MTESRPRELTAEELELLKTPTHDGAGTAPLTVPPGTQVPVHLINPVWNPTVSAASTEPTALPPDSEV